MPRMPGRDTSTCARSKSSGAGLHRLRFASMVPRMWPPPTTLRSTAEWRRWRTERHETAQQRPRTHAGWILQACAGGHLPGRVGALRRCAGGLPEGPDQVRRAVLRRRRDRHARQAGGKEPPGKPRRDGRRREPDRRRRHARYRARRQVAARRADASAGSDRPRVGRQESLSEARVRPGEGFDAAGDHQPCAFRRGGAPGAAVPDPCRASIAPAKAKPNSIAYGSAGPGTPQHIIGEMFKQATDTDLSHIPYKGSAPATVDLLGNQIAVMFDESRARWCSTSRAAGCGHWRRPGRRVRRECPRCRPCRRPG